MLQPPLGTPHFTFRPERGMRTSLRSFWTTEHPYPSQQRYEGLAPKAHPSWSLLPSDGLRGCESGSTVGPLGYSWMWPGKPCSAGSSFSGLRNFVLFFVSLLFLNILSSKDT